MISIGETVKDFLVKYVLGVEIEPIGIDYLKKKWTILFFYPEDFSFICPTEVTGFNDHLEEVKELGAQILGVSVDSLESHKAWIKELKIKYPLISDENKELGKIFGVLDKTDNRCHRATFIINPDLKVEFVMVTSRNVGRSVHETIRVLKAIHTGDSCPADWDPEGVK